MQYPSGGRRDLCLRQSSNKLGQHMNLRRGRKGESRAPRAAPPQGQAQHVVPSGLLASESALLRKENPFFH